VDTCETCGGVVQEPNALTIAEADARRLGLTIVDREPPEQFWSEDLGACCCEECDPANQPEPEPEILTTSKGHRVEVRHPEAEVARVLGGLRSDFARSLAQSFARYGSWTAGQRPWAHLLANEAEDRLAAAQAAPQAPQGPGPFQAIVDLLHGAQAHLKFPKVRLDGLVLSVAGARARQPGTINLTDGGPYGQSAWYGRISLDGHHQGQAPEWVLEALAALAADPAGYAAATGQRVGSCCFCGRDLTDERSLAVGYGPVCADHWSLPWGKGVDA
jgi:hypothetical protein